MPAPCSQSLLYSLPMSLTAHSYEKKVEKEEEKEKKKKESSSSSSDSGTD